MSSRENSPDKDPSNGNVTKSDNSLDSFETQLQDFTSPDHFSDITLVVEDKPIHAHKTILSLASPVWLAMFSGDFKERRVDFVDLPGKNYYEVVELLQFIYPPCKKSVTEDNVYRVLPLSDEYQIKWLKDACEDFLLDWILQEASRERVQNSSDFAKFCVQHLYLGQLYCLSKMFSLVVNMTAELPFTELKQAELFDELDCRTLCVLFEKREDNCNGKITFLEHREHENKCRLAAYREKCVEIASKALKVKRMGTYIRICSADDSTSCACDSCIYIGRYFERIISQYTQ